MKQIFETDDFSVAMADADEMPVIGMGIIEMMLEQSVEEYNEEKDFEGFKTPLVASLSPVRFKILRIACEELADSRKDYHIIMSFIEKLEEIAKEKVNSISEEMEE